MAALNAPAQPLLQRLRCATRPAAAAGAPPPQRPQRRRVALCRCDKDTPKSLLNRQQQQQQQQKPGRVAAPPPPGAQQQLPQEWRVFDWSAYQVPWDVPWGGGTVAATMATWIAGFAGTAFLLVPAAYTAAAGRPLWELPPSGQADFALWSEVAELAVTAAILGVVAKRHGPEVQRQRLFDFSPARPFARGTGWLAWGLIGAAAAPLVVGATALALTALGYEAATSGSRGTVDGVAGMISMDGPTYARLMVVTALLAPLLEETLFRGFLLTSLTKVMPNWAAVVASATAFGLAHLSVKDLPILIALGCWLGAIYCRSRNLLTPMLVHGAWNGTVLTLLFWLTANGVDVQQLLKDGSL